VIVIDEIDALCRHRGGGSSSSSSSSSEDGGGGGGGAGGAGAHRDSVVNQLLSKIDGLEV
jgi:SpoVK/Ycf46/Vps4 family AAA+-type ATPase